MAVIRLPRRLLAGAAVLLLAASPTPPLRVMRWLAPEADAAKVLTTGPAECLAAPSDADAALAVEIGRAAFRSPLILGGQAARAGISCESCHRGGASNPDFMFPGVSGAPGTADVTSSLFSSYRGDGIDNPKPIPNLAGPRSALKVDQAPAGRVLESFIHGLVTEEFDGPEPPPAVLNGLAAYVRALSPAACPRAGTQAITLAQGMADARRAVAAARGALGKKDDATAVVMIDAARARLRDIDERFSGLPRDQARLRALDLDLSAALAAVRATDGTADQRLVVWRETSVAMERALARDASRSLYNAARISAARAAPAGGAGQGPPRSSAAR